MKAKNKILLLCVLLFVPSLFYSCIAQVKKGKKEVSGKVNIMYSKTNFESGEVDWIIPFDTIFIDLDNDGLNDAFHSYYFDWGRGQSGLIYSIFLGDGKGNFNYYKDNQHLSSGDNFKIKFVESGIFSVTMLYNDKNTLEIFFEYDEKSKDWFCHKYNVYDKPKEKLLRKITLQENRIKSYESTDPYDLFMLFEYAEKYPDFKEIKLIKDSEIRKKPLLDSGVFTLNEYQKTFPIYLLEKKDGWAYVKFQRTVEEFGWVRITDIQFTIMAEKSRIHSVPNQPTKMYLIKGDEVEYLEENGEWYKIRFYGKKTIEGWIRKSDVE